MAQTDEFEELREDYADKQKQRHQRLMRKRWSAISDIGNTISCQWLTLPDGPVATALVTVGEEEHEYVSDGTTIERDGRLAFLDPFFAKHGGRDKDAHRRVVEAYALWKWHTARGTPVDERDNYLLEPDYEAPKFKWTAKVAKAA